MTRWLTRSVAVALVLQAVWAPRLMGQAPERSADTSDNVEPQLEATAQRSLIGMEAYREILASGTYTVGAGDEFLIYITGMAEPDNRLVLASGGLFVPGVGTVRVAGLTLADARARVEREFSTAFKQGAITIELSALRSFPVSVVGAVASPGGVVCTAVERVSEVIRKVGGLGALASHRNIRVFKTSRLDSVSFRGYRNTAAAGGSLESEQLSVRVDLERFNVTGDSRYNPFVEDGDRIVVPPRAGDVALHGAAHRSGNFEFVPGDRISDLLALAQGPTMQLDRSRVVLFRKAPDGVNKVTIPIDLIGALEERREADIALEADDWLVLRSLPNAGRSAAVRIAGEVRYPGYYVVERGVTRLRDVVKQAGGFTQDASISESRMVRPRVASQSGGDPEFSRIATIAVSDRTEEEDQYFIMKSRERRGQMVVDFEALFERDDESQNLLLLPEDEIFVPLTQQTVVVSGQAANPGAVRYAPGLTVWDYVDQAGGFGWRASRDIRVIKGRTGETKRAVDVDQIDPGDRIWIKEKPHRDYWGLFRETMAVLGQLSTVILVYTSLTK
jgi:polysaccharide biosynthesis/export protein